MDGLDDDCSVDSSADPWQFNMRLSGWNENDPTGRDPRFQTIFPIRYVDRTMDGWMAPHPPCVLAQLHLGVEEACMTPCILGGRLLGPAKSESNRRWGGK